MKYCNGHEGSVWILPKRCEELGYETVTRSEDLCSPVFCMYCRFERGKRQTTVKMQSRVQDRLCRTPQRRALVRGRLRRVAVCIFSEFAMPCSLEVFVPRAETGVPALLARLARFEKAGPRVLSLSGKPAAALEFAKKARAALGAAIAIQVQCESCTPKADLESFLTQAIASGVTEVLLLPAAAGGRATGTDAFASVLEMVSFVVERFGEKLGVAVTGYLRGTKGEAGHYSKDVAICAEQVKAGATRVITTPVWDTNHLIQFQMDLKSAGAKTMTLDPALLPLHALDGKGDFERLCTHFEWTPPKGLASDLEKLTGGSAAWQALGARYFKSLHGEVAERCKGCMPHVITLNHAAALDAMRSVGYDIPVEAPAAAVSSSSSEANAPKAAAATAASAGLSVPAGSTIHILHSNKLALEVGELVKALIAKSFPSLKPTLTCTEGFKSWATEQKLLEVDGQPPLYAIFIVETVEEGQPSEAAGPCTRFINKRSNPSGCLSRLHYCVLGLGDSNLLLDRQTTKAKDCNQAAQGLNARIAELGGKPFYRYGESDDRTGNQEIQPWVAGLESALCVA